jgi:hypothetical protein
MSKRDLVNSYLGRRISRRVFVQGLVASGVSISAALAYAKALGAETRRAGGAHPPRDHYGHDHYGHDHYGHHRDHYGHHRDHHGHHRDHHGHHRDHYGHHRP